MVKRDKVFVFIDIDGVTGNLRDHLEKHTGKKLRDFSKTTSFAKILGMTNHQLSEELDTIEFWETIPLLPTAKRLIAILEENFLKEHLYFCSTIISPKGNTGRALWIKKHFSEFYKDKRFIFCPHKWLLAHSKAILIDDYERNYIDFRNHGGYAILYPAEWNRNNNPMIDPIAYVNFELETILIGEETD